MSEVAMSRNAVRRSTDSSRIAVWVVFAAWFAAVFVLGASNAFVARPGLPPLALLIAFIAPVMAFLLSVRLSPSIRELALSADLRFATAVQAWRVGGYSFLLLYAYGYLPGYFAWPAAVGDMFIGFTAPWVLSRISNPDFLRSGTFVGWNLLGILDLVVAVGMGGLGSALIGNSAGLFTTTIMSQMPLVLVPTFFGPTFLVLHLVALMQARRSIK